VVHIFFQINLYIILLRVLNFKHFYLSSSLPSSRRENSNLELKTSPSSSSLRSPLISNNLKLRTISNIALSNSINNLSKHSSKNFSKQAHHQLKKLNKTKFSALNSFQLNELTSSSTGSLNSSGSADNQAFLEDIFDNGFNLSSKEKFNEKIQHNLNPQSSLLRKLRMNESENTNKAEIFVRPIPIKAYRPSNEEKNSIKHKIQPFNINLAPLIKNFRMNSFEMNKLNGSNKQQNSDQLFMPIPTNSIEFNIDPKPKTYSEFNFKPFKPYQEIVLKNKPSSPVLNNFEITSHPNSSLKPIDQNLLHNKSINYLANGIFEASNAAPNLYAFKSSSYVSLNRKLDLDDIEYFDFNELFTNNNPPYFKLDNQRKKLSQINEESTISNTPMSDSRWSSSLSTNSEYNQKMDANSSDETAKEELWSANNSGHSARTSNTNQYGRPVRRNSRPMLGQSSILI
jgi:hypothetical protein